MSLTINIHSHRWGVHSTVAGVLFLSCPRELFLIDFDGFGLGHFFGEGNPGVLQLLPEATKQKTYANLEPKQVLCQWLEMLML